MSKKSNKIENEQIKNSAIEDFIENKVDFLNSEPSFSENIDTEKEEGFVEENSIEGKVEEIEIKAEENNIEQKMKIESKTKSIKKLKRTGKVEVVSSKYILVKDEDGYYHTVYNHPEAKYGDIIEY